MIENFGEKANAVFDYILTKGAKKVTKETRVNTTYTFIEENDDITYVLVANAVTDFYAMSILSQGYNDVINYHELLEHTSEKSKLVWDLLENGGVREYNVQLLMKKPLPTKIDTKDIDWSTARIK